jgi:hypothetical protein
MFGWAQVHLATGGILSIGAFATAAICGCYRSKSNLAYTRNTG